MAASSIEKLSADSYRIVCMVNFSPLAASTKAARIIMAGIRKTASATSSSRQESSSGASGLAAGVETILVDLICL